MRTRPNCECDNDFICTAEHCPRLGKAYSHHVRDLAVDQGAARLVLVLTRCRSMDLPAAEKMLAEYRAKFGLPGAHTEAGWLAPACSGYPVPGT